MASEPRSMVGFAPGAASLRSLDYDYLFPCQIGCVPQRCVAKPVFVKHIGFKAKGVHTEWMAF